MFLTYSDPLNYWKTWFQVSSNHVIIIHNKYPLTPFWQKYALPDEYIVQTSWGSPSLVKATLSLLKYATIKQCTHYVLSSDSCVPLYNFDKTVKSIGGLKLSNIHEKKTIRKGGILYKTQCQWCIFIHSDALKLIANDNTSKYSIFKVVDEVYFANEIKAFTKKQLTYVNWICKTRGKAFDTDIIGNHPKVWKNISVPDVHYIRSTDALFMRKCTNETNFDVFQTPMLYFGEAEKNIFRKKKKESKDKRIHAQINLILKSSIKNIAALCQRQLQITKSDRVCFQVWTLLDQILKYGSLKFQIIF